MIYKMCFKKTSAAYKAEKQSTDIKSFYSNTSGIEYKKLHK